MVQSITVGKEEEEDRKKLEIIGEDSERKNASNKMKDGKRE
jgi:riboflavin synthase